MTEETKTPLQDLLDKLPDALKPVAQEYGLALLKMGVDELWAWIDLLAKGKEAEAYEVVLAKMDNADVLSEWSKLNQAWAVENARNAASMDLQRRAMNALLSALLTVAVVMVGL